MGKKGIVSQYKNESEVEMKIYSLVKRFCNYIFNNYINSDEWLRSDMLGTSGKCQIELGEEFKNLGIYSLNYVDKELKCKLGIYFFSMETDKLLRELNKLSKAIRKSNISVDVEIKDVEMSITVHNQETYNINYKLIDVFNGNHEVLCRACRTGKVTLFNMPKRVYFATDYIIHYAKQGLDFTIFEGRLYLSMCSYWDLMPSTAFNGSLFVLFKNYDKYVHTSMTLSATLRDDKGYQVLIYEILPHLISINNESQGRYTLKLELQLSDKLYKKYSNALNKYKFMWLV